MDEFEIKEAFSVGFGNVSLEEMADVGCSMESAMIKAVAQYALDANDEINRLFAESVSSNQQRLEPDWTPIESVEQVGGLMDGYYLLRKEHVIGWRVLKKSVDELEIVWTTGLDKGMVTAFGLVQSALSYKLIHAFEKPEKTYRYGLANYTAKRIAEDQGFGAAHELARDLLASQQRVRELEGDNDTTGN